MANDLTVGILKQIRDGISLMNERQDRTNEQLGQTNEQLGQTNERLGQTNERLGRVEQGLLDLGQFMRQIALAQAKHERFHTQHVDVLEKDIQELLGLVESHDDKIKKLEEQQAK